MGFFRTEKVVEPEPPPFKDGRKYETDPEDAVFPFSEGSGERGMHLIELATIIFQAAIIIRGEPEDATHNAIVAKRNALAMITQLNKDVEPPK